MEAVFVIPTSESIAAMASEKGVTTVTSFYQIVSSFSNKPIHADFSMQNVISSLSYKYVTTA